MVLGKQSLIKTMFNRLKNSMNLEQTVKFINATLIN